MFVRMCVCMYVCCDIDVRILCMYVMYVRYVCMRFMYAFYGCRLCYVCTYALCECVVMQCNVM